MDNLVEQLRTAARTFREKCPNDLPMTTAMIEQAADTIDAQARLLELAETLAGAVHDVDWLSGGLSTAKVAACALTAAQAEYASTGKVPCPECEANDKVIELSRSSIAGYKNSTRLFDEKVFNLENERDDLRRQLAEAQERSNELHQELQCRLMNLRTAGHETSKILADNAALVEALRKCANLTRYQHTSPETVEAVGVTVGNLVQFAVSQPHPGAGLLAELAALRKALEQIAILAIRDNDNTGTLMLAVEIATDAIRNRKDDR